MVEFSELMYDILKFSIATGLLVWAIKSIVKQFLDKDIESYKAELKREQIRFSKLHEERGIVMAELYEKLVSMVLAAELLFTPMESPGDPSREERGKQASDAINNFLVFSQKKEIYFDKNTCELLNEIRKRIRTSYIKFMVFRVHDKEDDIVPLVEKIKTWEECWKEIKYKIPELMEKLKNEFREILGVKL